MDGTCSSRCRACSFQMEHPQSLQEAKPKAAMTCTDIWIGQVRLAVGDKTQEPVRIARDRLRRGKVRIGRSISR